MNAKTVKLLRKYAKFYGYDPDAVKKAFQQERPDVQVILVRQMKEVIYGKKQTTATN